MSDETLILGPEYDVVLRNKLMNLLRGLGASKVDSSWGVGGSQEIDSLVVEVNGQRVVIESETYIGLSIRGEGKLIQSIADALKQA